MDIINKNMEYKRIIFDIVDNPEFLKIEKIKHHNSNRLEHSLKVSYYSYLVSKFLRLNYIETARGGLLHDFYLKTTVDYDKFLDKFKLYTINHPKEAARNSSNSFNLSLKEKDMIESHMFPLSFKIPKYSESWIVNMVDTVISTYEFAQKFSYKFAYAINFWVVFLVNTKK